MGPYPSPDLLGSPEPAVDRRGHLTVVQNSRRPYPQVLPDWMLEGLAQGEKVLYVYAKPAVDCGEHDDGEHDDGEHEDGEHDDGEHDDGEHAVDSSGVLGRQLPEGVDLVPLEELGRLDPEELLERALAEGFAGLRLSIDLGASLELLGRSRTEALERALDRLCASGPVVALCRLDDATCEARPGLVASHLDGVFADALAITPVAGGMRIVGEIDLVNERVFAAVLRTAVPSGGTMRVDVAKLRFLSVGGARILVQATDPCRRRGGRVLLVEPSAVVRRVLSACGYADCFELETATG